MIFTNYLIILILLQRQRFRRRRKPSRLASSVVKKYVEHGRPIKIKAAPRTMNRRINVLESTLDAFKGGVEGECYKKDIDQAEV